MSDMANAKMPIAVLVKQYYGECPNGHLTQQSLIRVGANTFTVCAACEELKKQQEFNQLMQFRRN